MTLALDIAGDFEAFTDGLAAVTLRNRDGSETEIEKSLRRAISTREAAASDGKYLSGDVVFHFAASAVQERPELGAVIEDDDGEWTILEVALQTLGNRWRCVCRNLGIVEQLDTALVLQVATYVKGVGGAQEVTWSDVAEVAGRVQLQSAAREVEHGSKLLPQQVKIYLAQQVLVTTNHRFVARDESSSSSGSSESGEITAIYKVVGWESPDRIDQLFVVHCEVTKWPLS